MLRQEYTFLSSAEQMHHTLARSYNELVVVPEVLPGLSKTPWNERCQVVWFEDGLTTIIAFQNHIVSKHRNQIGNW
jgi:hypothetical protein